MFILSQADVAGAIATIWAKVREWRVYFEGYGASLAQIERVAVFEHYPHCTPPDFR